eukprot:GHVQ01004070.1.p1 GENE.GHVQ01004070.1~~GHVQ01004070.1.p1  ORF type:complete len:179 (+),score=18.81 GHVQ01004070.1:162-698(+)
MKIIGWLLVVLVMLSFGVGNCMYQVARETVECNSACNPCFNNTCRLKETRILVLICSGVLAVTGFTTILASRIIERRDVGQVGVILTGLALVPLALFWLLTLWQVRHKLSQRCRGRITDGAMDNAVDDDDVDDNDDQAEETSIEMRDYQTEQTNLSVDRPTEKNNTFGDTGGLQSTTV